MIITGFYILKLSCENGRLCKAYNFIFFGSGGSITFQGKNMSEAVRHARKAGWKVRKKGKLELEAYCPDCVNARFRVSDSIQTQTTDAL